MIASNLKRQQQATEALRAVLAGAGERPFRRSEVTEALLGRWRRQPDARERAARFAAEAIRAAATDGRITRHGHQHWIRARAGRQLVDGRPVVSTDAPVKAVIESKAIEKWLAVDLGTGQVWQARADGDWQRAGTNARAALRLIANGKA